MDAVQAYGCNEHVDVKGSWVRYGDGKLMVKKRIDNVIGSPSPAVWTKAILNYVRASDTVSLERVLRVWQKALHTKVNEPVELWI